jgi:hypothetical protein
MWFNICDVLNVIKKYIFTADNKEKLVSSISSKGIEVVLEKGFNVGAR